MATAPCRWLPAVQWHRQTVGRHPCAEACILCECQKAPFAVTHVLAPCIKHSDAAAGTPEQIGEVLPALMANLRMMHAMSRHYTAPARLAVLLQKIARQVRAPRFTSGFTSLLD